VHVYAQCVVHAHAHFTLTISNKNQSRHAHFSHDMHIFDMHISLCPGVGISVGYYRRPKIMSKRETGFCFLYLRPHHGHNSLTTPPIKSPPPKSILVRFGPVKWQNLSTAPDELVYYMRIAVVASLPPRNRPQNEKYFDFVPLHPPDQIASPEVNSCPFWTW